MRWIYHHTTHAHPISLITWNQQVSIKFWPINIPFLQSRFVLVENYEVWDGKWQEYSQRKWRLRCFTEKQLNHLLLLLTIFKLWSCPLWISLHKPLTLNSSLLCHWSKCSACLWNCSQHLNKCLSETLTHFYTLAGRVRNNLYVECNDEGAEFLEARINCSMSKVLENPDVEMLRKLVPTCHAVEGRAGGAGTGPRLLVQTTGFECGGMAIGLSISHKIMDAASRVTFPNCWTATALDSSNVVVPEFDAAALFSVPATPNPSSHASTEPPPPSIRPIEAVPPKSRTTRFVFDAQKICSSQVQSS